MLVTRSRAQSSSLSERLIELGANAIECPVIRIQKTPENGLKKAIANIAEYGVVVFTSQNSVEIFFDELECAGLDSRALAGLKIAVVGKATAAKLKDFGLKADVVPERFIQEALIEKINETVENGSKILLPIGSGSRTLLFDALSENHDVERVFIYDTVKSFSEKEVALEKLKAREVDCVTFTSSSTVKNFIEMIGSENIGLLKEVRLISIGPVTSETIETYGIENYEEADEFTVNGVINKILKAGSN